MAGSDNGAVVVPGDVANSLLVELVANQRMPKRGPMLTLPQVKPSSIGSLSPHQTTKKCYQPDLQVSENSEALFALLKKGKKSSRGILPDGHKKDIFIS